MSLEVPNSEANIIWKCVDESLLSCSRVIISRGTSDLDNIIFNKYGDISCLFPITTQTTLTTATSASSTITETDVTVQFSTSFPTITTTKTASSSISTTAKSTAVPLNILPGDSQTPTVGKSTVASSTSIADLPQIMVVTQVPTSVESLDARYLHTTIVTAACSGITT